MAVGSLEYLGSLKGHDGWVTGISVNALKETIISSSRDNTLILWEIEKDSESVGYQKSRLRGHTHFVSDVVMSSDGTFALSSSWDKTLRLWDLEKGVSRTSFVGHTNDVLSVSFSKDNRQIVSCSRDKSIILWNTRGEMKYIIGGEASTNTSAHTDWVNGVVFNPVTNRVISCGSDKVAKVWNLSQCKLSMELKGHNNEINCVTVSPDGSLCATGGKDAKAMIWNLSEEGSHSFTFDATHSITALCFSPKNYWLCAAVGPVVVIWDLGTKEKIKEVHIPNQENLIDGKPKEKKSLPDVTSLCWSSSGDLLYVGYADHLIRVYSSRK